MKSYKSSELQARLAERLAATEWAPGRTFAGKWWGPGQEAEARQRAEKDGLHWGVASDATGSLVVRLVA
jgi:hypothetical protein